MIGEGSSRYVPLVMNIISADNVSKDKLHGGVFLFCFLDGNFLFTGGLLFTRKLYIYWGVFSLLKRFSIMGVPSVYWDYPNNRKVSYYF